MINKYFLEEVSGEIQVRKVDIDVKGGSVLMGKLYMSVEEAKIITNLETH